MELQESPSHCTTPPQETLHWPLLHEVDRPAKCYNIICNILVIPCTSSACQSRTVSGPSFTGTAITFLRWCRPRA